MRVLITGGLGFIGWRLARHLRRTGVSASVVDCVWNNGLPIEEPVRAEVARRQRLLEGLAASGLDAGGIVRIADLLDADRLDEVLAEARPTHVVHLAGLSRVDVARQHPERALEANIVLTHRLLAALERHEGIRRVVFASSSMVYGHFETLPCPESAPCRPVEPYGASKLACEDLLAAWGRQHGVETVAFRTSSVYGSGDFNGRVMARFVESALAHRPLVLNENGQERLDFTFVDDLVDGIGLLLRDEPLPSDVFNMTRGEARTLMELAGIIQEHLGPVSIELRPVPSDRPRRGALDISKARQCLGFSPAVSLEEGLRRVLAEHVSRA